MAGKKKKKIVRPAYTPKAKESKPLTKNQKLGILIGAAVLVVAILLFALLYDDGSLDVKKGEIVGAQESWIVSDLSDSSKSKYYKLGEITPLEGFTNDPEATLRQEDDLSTDFTMMPDDETAEISDYYVTGVANDAQSMIETIHNYYTQLMTECGEISEITLADGTVVPYLVAKYVPGEDVEGEASQCLCAYIPAERDASILISVNNTLSEGREELSEDALRGWAERIIDTITVETKSR